LWEYTSQYTGKFLVFISTRHFGAYLVAGRFWPGGLRPHCDWFFWKFWKVWGLGQPLFITTMMRSGSTRLSGLAWAWAGYCLWGAWFVVAPFAGAFFKDPQAVPITRALGFTFLISAFHLVHRALLMKKLAFGRKFVPEMARSITKGAISISLALLDFGAWSLIIGQLAGTLAETVVYWLIVPWRPRLRFQPQLASSLMAYGTKVISIEGLGILMLNADYLLIGRYMSAAALGTYTLAFRVPNCWSNSSATSSATLPSPSIPNYVMIPRPYSVAF
jgi:hypothetical protein